MHDISVLLSNTLTATGIPRATCLRLCASVFGLRSQSRVHR